MGSLHSWSAAAVSDDVLLDLRHFRDVRVDRRDGQIWVTAGAGCQIKRLLAELERQDAGTLPSLGLITEQTIAGAVSTGTHGSGKPSMSNFVEEVQVAQYDASTGEPVIRTIHGGDELRAARCSLGALGVILSVSFWSRPRYNVEECFRQYDDLESVVAREEEFPLQQFFLMPWWWRYFAQHRRETEKPRSWLAPLYRLYFFLQFDIGLHLMVRFVVRQLRSPALTRWMFRRITPLLVIRNWKVVDDSNRMLVMEHELFQHIEIEMFVTKSRLPAAVGVVVQLLKHFGGETGALSAELRGEIVRLAILDEVDARCGSYTHHYPICVRRVLPDDALISMTSGCSEPSYALSFISYASPADRQGFASFAGVLCQVLGALFAARPHWGKVCPISAEDAAQLYPALPTFRDACQCADAAGAFRNDWVKLVLFGE